MPKKVRKTPIPRAPVLAVGEAAEPAAVLAKKKKKKAEEPSKTKGRYLAIEEESGSDDDIAPAKAFEEMEEMSEDMEEGMGEEMGEDDESSFGFQDDADEEEESDVDDDFEAKASKFQKRLEEEQREAMQETMMTAMKRKAKIFGRKKEGGEEEEEEEEEEIEAEEQEGMLSIQQRKDRIQEVLRVLESFSEQREGDHSRTEYLAIFKEDLQQVYDYGTWLLNRFLELFPPRELYEFLEANEKPRPLTIRTNTLKTTRRDLAQALGRKGMDIQPTGPWSKVGLQIFESDVAVGSTTEYLAGQYIVQSASSFLPVISLAPTENMRVLDMCAAPGGKTTYLGQLMKNTGVLVANDVSAERLLALRGNLFRMGVTNCIITNYDGAGYERVMANFDRILLDAPCTGVGVISRDPNIKTSKSEKDVSLCTMIQKKLLLSAIDSCKVGGYVVYSTCSILVEENEGAVDYALKRRYVKIVDSGLPFGRPGFTKYRHHRFDPSLTLSRRYYPHIHNMDGFYVCKIEKLKHGENKESKWYKEKKRTEEPWPTKKPVGMPPPPKALKREAADAPAAEKKAKGPAGIPIKVLPKSPKKQKKQKKASPADGNGEASPAKTTPSKGTAAKKKTKKKTQ